MINLNATERPEEPPMQKRVNKYPVHWTSKMLMPLPDEIFTGLLKNIEKEGQLEPVILWRDPKTREEHIIDGNHRQQVANILGNKLKVTYLPKNTKEEELPYKVLSKQFHRRGGDNTYCCCEALDAIETIKAMKGIGIKCSAASMIRLYPEHLNKYTMSQLKTIKRVRPVWFQRLKAGLKVTPDGWKAGISSPKTLADHCREEERGALMPDEHEEVSEQDKASFVNIASSFIAPAVLAASKATSSLSAVKFVLEAEISKL